METSRVLLFILRRFFEKSTFYNNTDNLVTKSRTTRDVFSICSATILPQTFTANQNNNKKIISEKRKTVATFDSTETNEPLKTPAQQRLKAINHYLVRLFSSSWGNCRGKTCFCRGKKENAAHDADEISFARELLSSAEVDYPRVHVCVHVTIIISSRLKNCERKKR